VVVVGVGVGGVMRHRAVMSAWLASCAGGAAACCFFLCPVYVYVYKAFVCISVVQSCHRSLLRTVVRAAGKALLSGCPPTSFTNFACLSVHAELSHQLSMSV